MSSNVQLREYQPSDLKRLLELHNGQRDFQLPDPLHPLAVVKECVTDETGIVRAAGIARLEVNVTLLLDHSWATPQDRFEAVRKLQSGMSSKCSALGLDWAYAEADQLFGKRLEELGWIAAKKHLYFLRID